jgi:WD40 repeat protein
MRALALFAIAVAAHAQSFKGDRVLPSDAAIRDLAFLKTGETAAFCADAKIRVWDTQSGKLMRTIPLDPAIQRAAFEPISGRIVTVGPDIPMRVADLDGRRNVRDLAGAAMRQGRATFSPDGSTLATSGRDKSIRLWDLTEGRERISIRGGLGGASAIAISPDGMKIVAADDDTNLRVWNTRNGELLRLIDELPVTTFALAFSPDGKILASAGVDRIVYLWDTANWKLLRKITGQAEMISALAFSRDGRLLVTGGFSDISSREPVSILLHDVVSGKVIRSMASSSRVSATEFSADGKYIATANRDKAVNLWQVP